MKEMNYSRILEVTSKLNNNISAMDIADKEMEILKNRYEDDLAYIKRKYNVEETKEDIHSLKLNLEECLKVYLFNIAKNIEMILNKELELKICDENSPFEKISKKLTSLNVGFSSCSFDYSFKECEVYMSEESIILRVWDDEYEYNTNILVVPLKEIELGDTLRPLILNAITELESIEGKLEMDEYKLYLKLKEKFEEL